MAKGRHVGSTQMPCGHWVVSVSKKGRPVSELVALAAARGERPEVSIWRIHIWSGQHRTVCYGDCSCPSQHSIPGKERVFPPGEPNAL
jgi:hypothetical protein